MKPVLLALVALSASCKDNRPIELFSKPQGQESFDHSIYHALLQAYVDDQGMVRYADWKANDLQKLDRYLDLIRAAAPSKMGREEALAFWINAYNAWTIRGILEFYPLKSIKDKVSHLGRYNIWDDYKIKVEEKELSLNDIEHRILRKMEEPRIHCALVCAARGCPRLLNEAYARDRLNEQLDRNARHFFAQAQNFQLDRDQQTVHLSSILDWYKEDFGKTDKDRLAFCSRFLSRVEGDYVVQHDLSIKFISYNWDLNEQGGKK